MEAMILNVDLSVAEKPSSDNMGFFDWLEPVFEQTDIPNEKVEISEPASSKIASRKVEDPSLGLDYGAFVQWISECSTSILAGKGLYHPITRVRMNHVVPGFEEGLAAFAKMELSQLEQGTLANLLLSTFMKEEYKVYQGLEIIGLLPQLSYSPETRLGDILTFLEGFRHFHLTAKTYKPTHELSDGEIIIEDRMDKNRLTFKKTLVITVNSQNEVERKYAVKDKAGCRLVDLYGRRRGYFVIGSARPFSIVSIVDRELSQAVGFTQIDQWNDYIQSVKERYPQRYFFQGEYREGIGAHILAGVMATFENWKEGNTDTAISSASVPSSQTNTVSANKEAKPTSKKIEEPKKEPRKSMANPVPREEEEPKRRSSESILMDEDMFF